jgi:hypothetical protein
MAKAGSVRLAGRFKPGTDVRLVKVRDERVLRAEGGEEVGSKKVDSDGTVEWTSGVEAGARYFACGYVDGTYLEVRLRGREKDEADAVNEQPPIGPDRVKLSDGSWLDEPPEQHQKAPKFDVAVGQHQVPKDAVQRSDTPRGVAAPVDPDEQAPYGRQEDVGEKVPQMSSTETGRAAEIVKTKAVKLGSGAPVSPGAPNDRDVTSGHDAMGQPVYPDVAVNVGIKSAKKGHEGSSLDSARTAKKK